MDRWLRISISLAIALASFMLMPEMDWKVRGTVAITILMACLWIGETMPLYATALLGSALFIIVAGFSPREVFAPYASPVVVLLLGGFALAAAMRKSGLDGRLAGLMSRRFGSSVGISILGIMATTAFLSFWISNTAAAAIMIPIGLQMIRASMPDGATGSRYAKALIMGIAFSATIGGIGVLVGTPPNAIAVAELARLGFRITFLDWFFHALPMVIVMVPLSWGVLMLTNPPEIARIKLPKESRKGLSRDQRMTLMVGGATAALWMGSSVHGAPDSAVSVLAVVGLYMSGVLERQDIDKIDWGTLLLVGGSLSLGAILESSGISGMIGAWLGQALRDMASFQVFLMLGTLCSAVTALMSNTSTAALLVPITASLGGLAGAGVVQMTLFAGMASSLNFLTPMGTPPSAMAYSSGHISVMDMVKAGGLVTVAGITALSLIATLLW